jgi:hypothetical protein
MGQNCSSGDQKLKLTDKRTLDDDMEVIWEVTQCFLESLQWCQFPNDADTVLEIETFKRTPSAFVGIVLDINLHKVHCKHQLAMASAHPDRMRSPPRASESRKA